MDKIQLTKKILFVLTYCAVSLAIVGSASCVLWWEMIEKLSEPGAAILILPVLVIYVLLVITSTLYGLVGIFLGAFILGIYCYRSVINALDFCVLVFIYGVISSILLLDAPNQTAGANKEKLLVLVDYKTGLITLVTAGIVLCLILACFKRIYRGNKIKEPSISK